MPTPRSPITIVGGGLAGLVAATEAAEAGASVHLLEARSSLGGRARTSPGDYKTNFGPHAFYRGPFWDWLAERSLNTPFSRPKMMGIKLHLDGRIRSTPSRSALSLARHLKSEPPVGPSLRQWLAERVDDRAVNFACAIAGVLTFDHDPGRLSASFVWPKIGRILVGVPPAARYVTGGWGSVVERLTNHVRSLGVQIETDARVETLADHPEPIIVATSVRAARKLLNTDSLSMHGTRTALLDLGLVRRRGDPYVVSDADHGAFVDRFTAIDRTLAPQGHELVQASVGLRPGEELETAIARIEDILDLGFVDWRDRVTYRRQSTATDASGALDLPGTSWRDRQPIAYSDSIWIAGDWVAAPGHLSEVSWASAVEVARAAVAVTTGHSPARQRR